jgi:hypothetical protein
LFNSILLFDIPKNLLDIFFKRVIISKYSLGRIPGCNNNLPVTEVGPAYPRDLLARAILAPPAPLSTAPSYLASSLA